MQFLEDGLIADVAAERLDGGYRGGVLYFVIHVSPFHELIPLIRRSPESHFLACLRFQCRGYVGHHATVGRLCRGGDTKEHSVIFHAGERTRDDDIGEDPRLCICQRIDIRLQ